MTEYEKKYNEILKHFKVKKADNDLLSTRTYVSMDNIHDAILKIGINLEKPINYYVIKAKQFALNDIKTNKNRFRILKQKFGLIENLELEIDELLFYNFNESELILAYELVNKIKKYKSKLTANKYELVLKNLKEKLRKTLDK